MDSQEIIEYARGWGYRTLPKHHPGSLGYSGLVVAIRERPTQHHYDPQRLHLQLRDEDGEAVWRTFSWLTPTAESDHFCPGRIILYDRHDSAAEFFAFGGTVQAISGQGEWLYLLESPAPILELIADEESLADQLAAEVEELMAEAKAGWEGDDEGFDRRLGGVDPVRLYSAAVNSLLTQYQDSHALMASYERLAGMLAQEKAWLMQRHLWPAARLRIADLLSP